MSRSNFHSKTFALIFSLLIVLSGLTAVIPTFETVIAETTRGEEGNTRYVDDDAVAGGDGSLERPCQKIQDAVNASEDGDTVRVFNGTYFENAVVDNAVNLIGNGSKNTTIDGGGSGDVVKITADWVNMSGFMVTGSGGSTTGGIKVESDHNMIFKNNCSNNGNGIFLDESSDCTIANNTCSNNVRGIYLYRSSDCTLTNNTCSSNNERGIYLSYSDRNILKNNNCSSNRDYEGISLSNSNDCTIMNNICLNNHGGIILEGSSDCIITNNNFSNSHSEGIRLYSSSDCTITDNTISENREGIYLSSSSQDNTAHYNNIYNNANWGVRTSDDSPIDATNNWWGDASGPYHPTENPEGKGDNVTDYVDFEPWVSEKLFRTLHVTKYGNDTNGNGTKENPFLTIQKAVDESNDMDTIRVFEGVYEENVVVDKNVEIIGNGSGETVIDGLGKENSDGEVYCSEIEYNKTTGGAQGVAVNGDYVYIAAGGNGLVILDISDPGNPTEVGHYDTAGVAKRVAVNGSYAYIADRENGLVIVNISDPENPYEVGHYDTADDARDVAVKGNYAYVADDSNGLVIVNISDKENPIEEGHYDSPSYAWGGVVVRGDYAYVADRDYGLIIVNISDPENPLEVGQYDTPGWTRDLDVSGDFAYIADGAGMGEGIMIVDISDPTEPQYAGLFKVQREADSVSVAGNYAYVADWTNGLVIVDISDPGNPTEVGHYDDTGSADVAVSGDFVYVAGSELVIVEVLFPTHAIQITSPSKLSGFAITHGSLAGVLINSDNVEIDQCKINANYDGVKVINRSENVNIQNSDSFENSGLGINGKENGGKTIDAVNNWWGHPSGPYHPTRNPVGIGNEVSNSVNFEPWLSRPVDFKVHHVASDGNDTLGIGSKDNPYGTIQKAIDIAHEWDTIVVAAGTYSESITVNKRNVTIRGTSPETTILDADGTANTCTIIADNVELNGFTIKNGNDNGILMIGSSGNRIVNCIFPDNSYDLNLSNSHNNQIINTTFETVNFNDAFSSILVLWPIDLKVTDNRSGFIPNAHLKLSDTFGTTVFDGYTDYTGFIPQINILEYYQNISSRIEYNPCTISIRKDGYLDSSEEYSITSYTRFTYQLQTHIFPQAIISGELMRYENMDSTVNFDGTESTGRSIGYVWDFGDGKFSVSPTPSHTYTIPGVYQVNLTVTDDYDINSITSIIVIVENVIPIARAESDTDSAFEDEAIQFDALNSWDTPSDIISFLWDFGDGTQTAYVSPTHVYQDEGDYEVSLTAMDLFGGESTTNLYITITNVEPWIIATNVSGMQYPGKPLHFTVTADDITGDVPSLQYTWDLGDGTVTNEQNVTHAFLKAGIYNVTITVTDNNGATDSANIQITITDPEITTFVSSTSIFQDETVTFNASHELDDGSFIYTWHFGDGSSVEGKNISHVYTRSGTFNPWLIINNGEENTTILLQEITVENVVPFPVLQGCKLHVNEDEEIILHVFGIMESPSDIPILTYFWDFGDGSKGMGTNITHPYQRSGTYPVILTVSDGKATNFTNLVANVKNVSPKAKVGSDSVRKAVVGTPVIFDASASSDTASDIPYLNYTWKIGNGTVNGRIVSYTFSKPGTYSVILQVHDDDGATSEDTLTFEVSKSSESEDDETMSSLSWILVVIMVVLLVVIGFLISKVRDEALYKEMKAMEAAEEAIEMEEVIDEESFKPQDDVQETIVKVDEDKDGKMTDAENEVGKGGGGG